VLAFFHALFPEFQRHVLLFLLAVLLLLVSINHHSHLFNFKSDTLSTQALTFTLEPVFAAVFGGFFLHEEFGLATGIGGALAISAVLVRNADPQQLQSSFKEAADGVKARLAPRNP
jgi:drug/metabolite transporter (DMT)-like permease